MNCGLYNELLLTGYCVMMFPSMYSHMMGIETPSTGTLTGAERQKMFALNQKHANLFNHNILPA